MCIIHPNVVIFSSDPEKPKKDIKESEVYKMIHQSGNQGKINDADVTKPRHDQGHQKQGLSFKVLQWLTDTENDDNESEAGRENDPCMILFHYFRNTSNYTPPILSVSLA